MSNERWTSERLLKEGSYEIKTCRSSLTLISDNINKPLSLDITKSDQGYSSSIVMNGGSIPKSVEDKFKVDMNRFKIIKDRFKKK